MNDLKYKYSGHPKVTYDKDGYIVFTEGPQANADRDKVVGKKFLTEQEGMVYGQKILSLARTKSPDFHSLTWEKQKPILTTCVNTSYKELEANWDEKGKHIFIPRY